MSDINHNRMIPLHIADQAVAACNREIATLKAEVQRLTVNLGLDQKTIRNLQQIPEWSEVARLTAYSRELEAEVARLKCLAVIREGRLAVPYDYDQLREENARLRAYVERLEDAGWLMEKALRDTRGVYHSGIADRWQRAKEGKPSV